MVTVKEIYDFIDKIAPFESKMDFDNVGILLGDKNANVKKCILSLDISKEVLREAKEKEVDLLISHHPVIFKPIKSLAYNSLPYILASNNMNVICAHTNLDIADEIGVNACLARTLKLNNIKPLSEKDKSNIALSGTLDKSYDSLEFASYVKGCLGCKAVKYVSSNRKINKVAFCCGAGGEFLQAAIEHDMDAYVSADIKHHELLMAKEADITLVDAGHFATEDIVIAPLAKLLSDNFTDVYFEKSKRNKDVAEYLI